ncbi:DUF6461 domain-containing protein [Streptomyces sp. NPDC047990]|uniref:DUF6461 domain-containing protein n=1 Tax=Streptomyces sp. NPDC047990 TaxID=3365496 RepID=UPI00371AE02F
MAGGRGSGGFGRRRAYPGRVTQLLGRAIPEAECTTRGHVVLACPGPTRVFHLTGARNPRCQRCGRESRAKRTSYRCPQVHAGSHLASVNGRDGYLWAEDTVARLRFETGVADRRWGTTPDELPDAMHDIGSQFCGKPSDAAEHLATQAAFALAEHVAGVSITPELLRDADLVGGSTEIG